MTKPTFVAGDVPTASQVNEWMVNSNVAWKTATETVTSSTVLQDDDHLTVPVLASAVYLVDLVIVYDGPQAADLSFALSVPAGATAQGTVLRFISAATNVSGTETAMGGGDLTATISSGTLGTGVTTGLMVSGVVTVGGSAGNCKLQWAQGTSNASATRLFAGSYLSLRRVS